MMDKLGLLRKYFGHSSFRNGQETAVDALCHGQDVLAIMPTGAGKSVCYQLPALMFEGVSIVISPLISLMQDQVESLKQAGISAACINSTQSSEEFFSIMNGARNGIYKLIYVAPERLLTESFMRFAMSVKVSMVTVDEAHCVSQWGQDFRLSYLDIANFVERLPNRPVIGAFTATATEQVSCDIIKLLRLCDPVRVTTGFDRPNLFFSVEKPSSKLSALLGHLKRFEKKSGIVYCSTRKQVDELYSELKKRNIPVSRYHAGLTSEERADNQENFIYDIKSVMVATNAFGMGIDKSNVSFVIHYNMPKDIESYYQEAGRAGRDGEPAECILLYSGNDNYINTFLIEKSVESSEVTDPIVAKALYEKARDRLRSMALYCTGAECLRSYMLRYFGEVAPSHCGKCSGCVGKTEKKDITSEAVKIISCVYRGQQNGYHLSRTMTAKVLTGSSQKQLLDMRLDRLSTYGIMSEFSYSAVMEMIDALLAGGNLASRPFKEYSELMINEASAAVIRGKKKVSMVIMKREKETTFPDNVTPEEEALFQRLRKVREEIAMKEHVPPYVVFSNATLRDMCRKKPRNRSEFMEVSGVGAMRAEKYGTRFMTEIRKVFNN